MHKINHALQYIIIPMYAGEHSLICPHAAAMYTCQYPHNRYAPDTFIAYYGLARLVMHCFIRHRRDWPFLPPQNLRLLSTSKLSSDINFTSR